MTSGPRHRRSPLFRAVVGTLAVLFFLLFFALGTWQLKRRVWKLDLIARVEQRVHAPPGAAPDRTQWPQVTAATDEYRHVALSGRFLDRSQTLVQALTDLGSGYWVLTPLQTADGSLVLVNRGFVTPEDRDRIQPGGQGAVTGLLRLTEPGGAFLRHNDLAGDRWFSRDVQAIAQARGLSNVAPYFVDADAVAANANAGGGGASADAAGADAHAAGGDAAAAGADAHAAGGDAATAGADAHAAGGDAATARTDVHAAAGDANAAGAGVAADHPGVTAVAPVGGLTVVHFRNTHLVYAITWYTLALMVAGALWVGVRSEAHT